MAVLFSDDFNRADGSPGGNWSGALEIVSNQARLTGFSTQYGINTTSLGTANYEVEVALSPGGLASGGSIGLGLVARFQDGSNFYLLWLDQGGTDIILYEVSGGGYTPIDSGTYTLTNPITVKLSCNGTAIKGYAGGVEVVSATSSTHTAEGDFGLRGFNPEDSNLTAHRWDNLQVLDFAGAGPTYTRSLSGTQDAASGALAAAKLQKFHLLNSVASGSNHGALQTGGSPPSTATTGTGWTVGNEPSGDMASLDWGSEVARTTFSTTAMPASTINNTIGDSIRTDALTGTFAAGSWALSIVLRAVTAGGSFDGFIKARMWRGTDATGSGATEVGALTSGTTVTNVATSTDHTSVVTWPSVGQLVLNNEYLFFQIALQVSGAGAGTTHDALIRVGASGVLGTPFTPPGVRSLDGSQPTATGTLTRVHVTRGRALAGAQSAATGALSPALPGAPPTQALLINDLTSAMYHPWEVGTTQPLTIMFWGRLDSASGGHGNVTTIANDAFDDEVGFWIPDHRPKIYQASVMIDTVQTDILPPTVEYGEWHHVVFERDDPSGVFRVYQDGKAYPNETGTTPSPNGPLTNAIYFMIGSAGATQHWNGAFSQFRVWTARLSQAEVIAERKSPTAVRTSGLWADWKFDGSPNDTSSNARHALPLPWPTADAITYTPAPRNRFPEGTQDAPSGSLTVGAAEVSLAGTQPSGTGALSRLKALLRPLDGAQLAASAALTRVRALTRALAGAQGIPAATLSRLQAARGRSLTGLQGVPTGSLTYSAAGSRGLAGTQLAPTGALTRFIAVGSRALSGSQPAASGALEAIAVGAGPDLPVGGPFDDFDDGVVNEAVWYEQEAGSYAVTESGGTLNIGGSSSGGNASLRSLDAYDMTDRSSRVELAQEPSAANLTAAFRIGDGFGFGSSSLFFQWTDGNMQAGYDGWSEGTTVVADFPWPTGARWLRIGFDITDSGAVWFDYSVDGSTWEPAGNLAMPGTLDVEALQFALFGLSGVGTAASVKWDNFNPIPSRVLSGVQLAPGGVLTAVNLGPAPPTYTRSLAGAQAAPSGVLTRHATRARSLSGQQGVPSATLARKVAYKRALSGLAGIPDGALARAQQVARSLAGLQDRPSGTLVRLRIRTLAGVQPSGSAALSTARVLFRTLDGQQSPGDGVLLVLPPAPRPSATYALVGVAYSSIDAPMVGSATHAEESVPRPGVAVGV